MLKYLWSALWTTIKSGFGILGLAITALGVIGDNVEATKVNVWVCVVGLGLFSVAALWELGKALKGAESGSGQLVKANDRAWHFEQERDHYRRQVADYQHSWITSQNAPPSGLVGSTEGDVNQRVFLFGDPNQGILSEHHDEDPTPEDAE